MVSRSRKNDHTLQPLSWYRLTDFQWHSQSFGELRPYESSLNRVSEGCVTTIILINCRWEIRHDSKATQARSKGESGNDLHTHHEQASSWSVDTVHERRPHVSSTKEIIRSRLWVTLPIVSASQSAAVVEAKLSAFWAIQLLSARFLIQQLIWGCYHISLSTELIW